MVRGHIMLLVDLVSRLQLFSTCRLEGASEVSGPLQSKRSAGHHIPQAWLG